MFITIEANEGAGKSTQARMLSDYLAKNGYPSILTREPGGSPAAEEIRQVVLTGAPDRFDSHVELLLFNAARRCHLTQTVFPALEAGKVVICDRYLGSTLALQVAGGTSEETVLEQHRISCFEKMPDLTIFLDIDPVTSLSRGMTRLAAEGSAENRMELKGKDFHDRVDENFRKQAIQFGWSRIDATQSIEKVHQDILELILPKITQYSLAG